MDLTAARLAFGEERYATLCAEARRSALEGYGPTKATREDLLDAIHEVMEQVWSGALPTSDMLRVTQALFEKMPSYTYFWFLAVHFEELSDEDTNGFWAWIRSLLTTGDPAYLNTIGYTLWCDHFEDPRRVKRAWTEVTLEGLPDAAIRCILDHSGPVPYHLKEELYDRLLEDPAWHPAIYRSLLHSAHDAFGQIDKGRARSVFRRLELTRETQHLDRLRSKLRPWWAIWRA